MMTCEIHIIGSSMAVILVLNDAMKHGFLTMVYSPEKQHLSYYHLEGLHCTYYLTYFVCDFINLYSRKAWSAL